MVKLIPEVRYAPDLKSNLQSIGMLEYTKLYVISSGEGNMKISHGSMVMMKGKRLNGIYALDGKTIT